MIDSRTANNPKHVVTADSYHAHVRPGLVVVAIIPARGGSKTIPNKNIAPVAGRPLIFWTIAAAQAASSVDRIVVTTDSPIIAEVARHCGAEVPFLRPPELSLDDTPGIEPIIHAVQWLEEHESYRTLFVVALQPTSPLRTSEDIDAAIELALKVDADAVVSVSVVTHHPFWVKRIAEDGRLVDFLSLGERYTRRQDLPPAYALNGAIYLARRDTLLKERTWYVTRTYAYVMPQDRSLDIDTSWDLYLAELILRDRIDHERD